MALTAVEWLTSWNAFPRRSHLTPEVPRGCRKGMDPTPTPRGLTLRHLPANDAWAFLMGEALVPVDGTRLFASRKEAETTARRCGLRPLDPRLRRWA